MERAMNSSGHVGERSKWLISRRWVTVRLTACQHLAVRSTDIAT